MCAKPTHKLVDFNCTQILVVFRNNMQFDFDACLLHSMLALQFLYTLYTLI